MIAFRRAMHANPELPWQEVQTTAAVAAELDKLDIPYRRTQPTGIIAWIDGALPGKTVALRADMDALPVQELSQDLSYKSCNPGKMHACGHDAHTAMLLTAARALMENRDRLRGGVRLIFQPAEEIAEGAKAMIAQGALEGVDNVFGMHIWTPGPTGRISCNAGPSLASADLLKVRFRGRGGHGAMPQDCVDATLVASSFVMNLQAIVARETSPLDSAVVTIGRLEAGTRFNVIAEHAELEGTVRCFDLDTRKRIENAIRRYAEHTAAVYGATAEVEYLYGTLPVINETHSAHLVQSLVRSAFGEQALYQASLETIGEDFSYYTENLPGCFALLGCGNPDKDTTWAHHHGRFNVDEDAMALGAELYAQYAWRYLQQDAF
ncbi:amidohydrolase [Brenneria sp. 4F2]|nr:amidohydrolase [Brenneria bubanii]